MTIDEARQYVAASLLPAMGIRGREFTVAPPSEPGTRSSLYLVRADGMPPLLLRVFGHRSQAARNAAALRHLDALGLPAPRLVFYDLWPAHVTVETWVEGTRHAAIEDPEAAARAALEVARLLARYHAVTRATWGRPALSVRARLFTFAAATLRNARRMVRDLRGAGWLSEAEAAAVADRLAAWQGPVAAITPFSLVHNDANRHNFVVAPSGEVTPVDLHRLAYEPFPEEIANALFHFCRKDAALAGRFLETYFADAGQEAHALYDRTRGFFEPLNLLKKMHLRAQGRPESTDGKMDRWRRAVVSMEPPA